MTAHAFVRQLGEFEAAIRSGLVTRIQPSHIEASGPLSAIGDFCEIERGGGPDDSAILAQVVAVEDDHIVLVPLEQATGVYPQARVRSSSSHQRCPVGSAFGGRAVDAFGSPIDGRAPPIAEARLAPDGEVLSPFDREEPKDVLETGVRVVDALVTLGRGQRVGVFAASGVGKTTLIRDLALQTACDRCILCLVGERGREVEFLSREMAASPHANRFTVVAATSDLGAVVRVRAVQQAAALAEWGRARGEHVLLIVDSVTRMAMALREIGLAAGEPPTLRAYTPNVFNALPRLVERCGGAKSGGAITAVFTVLSETDDIDDPIVEVMKSLLDGHIVLSRRLAEQGQFPAVDPLRSVSRLATRLQTPAHAEAAKLALARLARYEEARLMIESGLYKSGGSPDLDEAIRTRSALSAFLKQSTGDRTPFAQSVQGLSAAASGRGHA